MLDATREMADQWRSNANADSPAGPLFVSGKFAEADITGHAQIITNVLVCDSGRCGTACSGSAGRACC
jgi:hypothetical protein